MTPRLDRSLRSAHQLHSAAPQDAAKACLYAAHAIFSRAKPQPPSVPAPPPAPPQTPKPFRLPASPSAPLPHPQTALQVPPAVHPSFPLTTRQKEPPPTYSQKPATAKSFPAVENNPPPSQSPFLAPGQQFRCLPEPHRGAAPPVSPFHTRDALASARSPSN